MNPIEWSQHLILFLLAHAGTSRKQCLGPQEFFCRQNICLRSATFLSTPLSSLKCPSNPVPGNPLRRWESWAPWVDILIWTEQRPYWGHDVYAHQLHSNITNACSSVAFTLRHFIQIKQKWVTLKRAVVHGMILLSILFSQRGCGLVTQHLLCK